MKFLVIGDIILDEYFYVSSERISQEANIPVWDIDRIEMMLGGAANVAAHIKSLDDDAVVHLAGITDYRMLGRVDKTRIDLGYVSQGQKMMKRRFVDKDLKILFRADELKRFREKDIKEFESWIHGLDREGYDYIVISDYDKGTLSDYVISKLMSMDCPKIVDSKRIDLTPFKGCDVLKINFKEYSEQVSCGLYPCVEDLFESVVVTLGKDGAEIRQLDKARSDRDALRYVIHTEKFPTRQAKVVDVTGCGDVHTAALSVALSRDHDIRNAVRFANSCASAMSEVFGTTKI